MPVAALPVGTPAAEDVMARASAESFPVASRVLPRRVRRDLLAIYGFARLLDELGDASDRSPAERLAALDWLEGQLEAAFQGRAEHTLLIALQPTLREHALAREPFARLIEANRVDQRVNRYRTWEQLRGYCTLSADPIGELVLTVFGVATPARIIRSNSICTALQLIEHCQDVSEDFARGRVYLPQEDLERFRCTTAELAGAHASGPLRDAIAFELARARALLADGAPLIDTLHGRARIAVAAFVAGGRAALEAIERASHDVLAGPLPVGQARRAWMLTRTLFEHTRGRA